MTKASIRRFFTLCFILLRHGIALVVEEAASRLKITPTERTVSGPQRLRSLFEDLGGAFVKLGQMLALQPDILPVEYCNALFNLLDRIGPFPFDQANEIFCGFTGKTFEQAFDSFNACPIATASIGQVYVAVYRGQKVAVKIQRPKVDKMFIGDIALSAFMARTIKALRLRKLYWLLEPLSEFVAWTYEELDYRKEACYMDTARTRALGNLVERVPKVFWEYSTERTLVVEYLQGINVLDYLRWLETRDPLPWQRLDGIGFDAESFARHIIDNFLFDAFNNGMFHADLHPANLMILSDNVVGYIDFGITGILSRHARKYLAGLTLALTRADVDGMCQAFMKVSVKGENSDPEAFRSLLKKVSSSWYEYSGKKQRLKKNLTGVMIEFLSVCRAARIWPERDVIKYIRSAVAIDGLITRFAPAFNLCNYLESVCARNVRIQMQNWLLSREVMLGVSRASSRLLQDGFSRAAMRLGELIEQKPNRRAGPAAKVQASKTMQMFRLSALVLLFSWLAVGTAKNAAPTSKLFLVEVGITLIAALGAVVMLWKSTVQMLVRRPRWIDSVAGRPYPIGR